MECSLPGTHRTKQAPPPTRPARDESERLLVVAGRQSHVSSLGKPKVSWALVSFSTEAEKQKALNGIEKLKLGPYVAAKPMDVERAIGQFYM